MNLTQIKGCYSKELKESLHNIKLLEATPTISVNQMINYVSNTIKPAFIEANAKKRFKENLASCTTKKEVLYLYELAVLHGKYYHVGSRKY